MAGRLAGGPIWLVSWLAGWLLGWLAACLLGWLAAGWVAGWMDGCVAVLVGLHFGRVFAWLREMFVWLSCISNFAKAGVWLAAWLGDLHFCRVFTWPREFIFVLWRFHLGHSANMISRPMRKYLFFQGFRTSDDASYIYIYMFWGVWGSRNPCFYNAYCNRQRKINSSLYGSTRAGVHVNDCLKFSWLHTYRAKVPHVSFKHIAYHWWGCASVYTCIDERLCVCA